MNEYENELILKKINTLAKIIEVLLNVIHYDCCNYKGCNNGSVCVPKKMNDLNVRYYGDYDTLINEL